MEVPQDRAGACWRVHVSGGRMRCASGVERVAAGRVRGRLWAL